MRTILTSSIATIMLAACGAETPEKTAELEAVSEEVGASMVEARSLEMHWLASGFEEAEGASVFGANAAWAGTNGILGDSDRLLVSTLTEGKLIDADGIGLVPGGGYLVSSWPGEIHHITVDGKVSLLVDTKADGNLQNDLSVFGDVVIVPNWEPGTVTAWRIVGQ